MIVIHLTYMMHEVFLATDPLLCLVRKTIDVLNSLEYLSYFVFRPGKCDLDYQSPDRKELEVVRALFKI